MTDLEGIRAMVQDAINSGASTVEEVHKKIAAMPLAALKDVEGLGEVGQSVEDLTNTTIGTIYDTIRLVNDQVGQVAKQMLEGDRCRGRW
jgi:methyl-accepting chemotaxis protein